ncbi:hypothetical protein B0H16DRAFT_1427500 [Mycena metata]|uniref:Decapping nuclease n=1 Tax=Mycena metata TaxID=1033252 RepID=A0AAD7MSU3_9AGAR|nr:hypothetical protein B0H16DRAFT_1427500 [Mycena metata]
MAPSRTRIINTSDLPQCPLPALLSPAKQSACFSICNERLEVDSTTALRYFLDPPNPVDADLREGLNTFLRLPREDRAFQGVRRLDNVFELCLASANSEELLAAEVVTWRGILTNIMVGKKLDLNVSYYRGVLYLEENCPQVSFHQDSVGMYMGYVFSRIICSLQVLLPYRHKFETICSTSNHPETDNVDLHTLWNAAITRTLGSLKILLVGEVDCVKPGYSEAPGPEHYVELKTRKGDGQRVPPAISRSIIPNLPRWILQSRLLGTPEIFVGFPDSAGVVRSCATVRVETLNPAQDQIDWGARVLHSLRQYCASSTPAGGSIKVWRVEARKGFVDVRKLSVWEVTRLNEGGVPRNGIIPVSFMEGLESRASVT